jgi:hypothetical protein
MLRRILAGALLAGAAVSAAAVPASAEPGPGPLSGSVSPQQCRAGGGTPLTPQLPVQQVGPVFTGTCLGGEYSLATLSGGGAPGLI